MSKKYSITHFFVVGLLIILLTPSIYAQDSLKVIKKDRIYKSEDILDSRVYYSCTDSIVANLKTNKISIFGEAEVKYDGIRMTADLIELDLEKNEVYAIYTLDEEGNRVGIPKFEEGAQSFTAASIRYNFDSEKGFIEELKTKQDEMYLHMGVAKRQKNEEIHFTEGKFTTCELDEPHFHFQLSKAVMVPNKRIATGPMNLWVKGIPTPLGLPFSVIPTKDQEAENGFIFPMITPVSNYGFGFQDLGYYFPIKKSENIQTTFYGSLYSRGTFEIKNQTDYKLRYKYTGNLNLEYSSFRQAFPLDSIRESKYVIRWQHAQASNANPYWRFNSNVNFISDNNGKTDLDPLNGQYFQNNFNSDINLIRSFPGKPITIGLKAGVIQNSTSQNIDANLPTLNVNVNRFYPFKGLRKNTIGEERFYEKIGLTYAMEAKNRAFFGDSLLDQKEYDLIRDQIQNGIKHNAVLSYPLQLFKKVVTLNTTASYNLRMNFQSIDKQYDTLTGTIRNDTLQGLGFSQDASFQTELSTNLYAYYDFVGKSEMKMRHVITPRISARFSPDISSFVNDTLGPELEPVYYSPYENSIYRESAGRKIGLISYSLNNTFELKHKTKNDTLAEEFTKTRIIDAFTINGNYDIFKDSMRFSDVNVNLRFSPLNGLSVVSGATLSPYAWDEDGLSYDKYAFKNNQGWGRVSSANISTTYTFTASESRDKIDKTQEKMGDYWGADFQYYSMNPHEVINFDIPWKINLTHTYFLSLNNSDIDERYNNNHNLVLSGDVSFTQRWKLGLNSSYDLKNKNLTQTRMTLTRDMHCWQLSFYWTPIGGQQSFMLRFNATSALFQSAKLELRKPPEFL
ncbi:putative LPS assembly protein LptD [Brumimicrobium aurantiacum]|uniref:putative LPS assembly protein LptD n=1 Tax=Brumimicrobium aurantiacum TaxID=1737063 RepID=UPI000F4D7714|nr:putative LPS assembly protein LptD [Brumimicrobium aurantiacum]